MNIQALVDEARKTLLSPFYNISEQGEIVSPTGKFASEANSIAMVGVELLQNLLAADLESVEEANNVIDEIILGTLAVALAYNETCYGSLAGPNSMTHAYIKSEAVRYSPVNWEQLEEMHRKHCHISDTTLILIEPILSTNDELVRLIYSAGNLIRIGKLNPPLEDYQKFLTVMPKFSEIIKRLKCPITEPLVSQISDTAHADDHIDHPPTVPHQQKHQQAQVCEQVSELALLKKAFADAMAACQPEQHPDSIYKKRFIAALSKLSKNTLASFDPHHQLFNFNKCLFLARTAGELAQKIGTNTVRKVDIEQFVENTKPFNKSNRFATILAAIVGAVLGFIAGAAVGFAVGGFVGAAIGGGAGLAVGMSIGGYGSFWSANHNNPLVQMKKAAAGIEQTPEGKSSLAFG